jgi:putative copper export protein
VLTPAVDSVRLFLHVLAATVWVGGQLTVAGLVPGLRALGADVPSTVASRFSRIAWPAFVLLVGTGIWNVIAVNPSRQSGSWQVTLWIKLAVVALSGVSAWLHGRARSRSALAAWGAISGLTAVVALLLGVLLEG